MAPKEKKTKAQISAAAAAGSRSKKKKWSKGKAKEKVKLAVFFDEAGLAKLQSDIPKAKLVTPYIVSERLKVNLSVAKAAIRSLASTGLLKHASSSLGSPIYTRV